MLSSIDSVKEILGLPNSQVVSALAADKSAWTVIEAKRRRSRGHADLGVPVAQPAYRADLS
jgi:hypothetical protein